MADRCIHSLLVRWAQSSVILRTKCRRALEYGNQAFGYPPKPASIHELPIETVWKIGTGPIVESLERADRDQQALFGHLVLPETTLAEPSGYFPDSLIRVLSETQRTLRRAE